MKGIRKDLTGQVYGRLKVIEVDEVLSTKRTFWVCECICGNKKTVRSDSLQDGSVKSCGCLKKEQDRKNLEANHSHKMSKTRIYQELQGVKARCLNNNNKRYENYGGRGIKICDEWMQSFESFRDWSFENGYSDTLTIDRINNDGNYEPGNCRWVDNKTQCNNRGSNIIIKYKDENLTMMQVSEITGINYAVLNSRYIRGDRSERLLRKSGADRNNKGSNNYKSKINEEQAINIKNLLKKGYTASEIQKTTSISKHIIYGIKQCKTWKHI